MAAATVDEDSFGIHTEFYAEIILTCRGQFDDPNFGSRLDDITNRLYHLAQGIVCLCVLKLSSWSIIKLRYLNQ